MKDVKTLLLSQIREQSLKLFFVLYWFCVLPGCFLSISNETSLSS